MKHPLSIALILLSFSAYGALDPLGCDVKTNDELRDLGYEPVEPAPGDDTIRIQTAIDTALQRRRVVYFRPGDYQINKTLKAMTEKNGSRNQSGIYRFGIGFLGSYCGTKKPTITLADGTYTNASEVDHNPSPMLVTWRERDDSYRNNLKDWRYNKNGDHFNSFIRNLKFVVGANPGAVGLVHNGAEGSSVQEVDIDAAGGFAGMWSAPSSGSHTYRVTITGGKYGIFIPQIRDGAPVMVGLTLRDQAEAPIASDHYGTITLVAADITHDDGDIFVSINANLQTWDTQRFIPRSTKIRSISSQATKPEKTGRWSVSLVDSKITITDTDNPAILKTGGPGIYLRNLYVRGSTNVVNTDYGGNLSVPNRTQWYRIPEYSTAKTYQDNDHTWIQGTKTTKTWFDGLLHDRNANITATQKRDPPGAMLTQHFYTPGVCNPERNGAIDVTKAPYNAQPRDSSDDTAAIQAAINAAGADGMVFLPYGGGPTSGDMQEYIISDTLQLKRNTEFCGVSRYSTFIRTNDQQPATNRPMVSTVNDASASPIIADMNLRVPRMRGTKRQGYQKYFWGIDWQSGNMLYRDAFIIRASASETGPRTYMTIRNNGGGKMYGWTGANTWRPSGSQKTPFTLNGYCEGVKNCTHEKFRDKDGVLTMSTDGSVLHVSDTVNKLNIYKIHCQFAQPPRGANCRFINTKDVSVFGGKGEQIPSPAYKLRVYEQNDPADIPVMAFIEDSEDFLWVGFEGLYEPGNGRAFMELKNNTNVTISGVGLGRGSKLGNLALRYVTKVDGTGAIKLDSHNQLLRNATTPVPEPPSTISSGRRSSGGPASPPTAAPPMPGDFNFTSSTL